jgi:hypothetical protein
VSAANIWRGEVALTLGEAVLSVRPSFAALVAAEAEIGPLFALVDKAADGTFGLGDMAALIWHCLADMPEGWSRDDLGEALLSEGLAKQMPVMRQIFRQILQGR